MLQRALDRWDHVAATTRISTIRRKSVRGLRIVSLRNDGLLANIGLRSGDVLRAVNGRAIARKRDLRRTVARFASGDRVTLALERGGQPLTLDYAPL
jgi:S1-C subfamily serine protease